MLGLRAVDRTLCVVPLSRAPSDRKPAAHAAGGRDAVLEVAEVQICGLAELHAICMNRHDGERMNDDSISIVGQQARWERMRRDDVPRTDLANQ